MVKVDGKFLVVSAVAWLLTGCGAQMIPNTDVEDTESNRSVIQFCEEYRKAVEQRNTRKALADGARELLRRRGNVDATDDLDYAGLKEFLDNKFRDTKAIRYEIRYRRVGQGRKDVIFVDYTYSASFKLHTEMGDVWKRSVRGQSARDIARRRQIQNPVRHVAFCLTQRNGGSMVAVHVPVETVHVPVENRSRAR